MKVLVFFLAFVLKEYDGVLKREKKERLSRLMVWVGEDVKTGMNGRGVCEREIKLSV